MPDVTASRTLVKSGPELWSECSDAESLARHLNPFGEIRITRLEPETAVAWEGEHASGTVRLQPSGWGTRVVLTATPAPAATATPAPAPAATPDPAPQEPVEKPAPAIAAQLAVVMTEPPEPAAVADPPAPVECQPWVAPAPAPAPAHAPGPRSGFFARLFGRWQRWVAPVEQEVGPVAERGAAPAEVVPEPVEPVAAISEPAEPVAAVSEPAEPEAAADEPSPEPTPPGPDPQVALLAALDSLGQAHHRPYSRA